MVDLASQDWDRTLAVNVTSAFLCAKHAARAVAKLAAIIHIIRSRGSWARCAALRGVEVGMIALTPRWRWNWARHGPVNAIAPAR